MIPRVRRLPLILVALLGLVVPFLGANPAQAEGTGSPVIITPADDEIYPAGEVPDLVVDFGDAPYGTYTYAVVDLETDEVLVDGTETYEAGDPAELTLAALGLGLGGYQATVSGEGRSATSVFGTFFLGEPPTLCSVNMPSKVVVVARTTAVWPTFDGCGKASVDWAIKHPRTPYDGDTVGLVSGRSTGAWRYRDSEPAGSWKVQPGVVQIVGIDQNSTRTLVKFGSRISLAAGPRNGTRVLLSGVASRYSPQAHSFRRWADRPIALSYKDCLNCPWKFLAMDRTNSYGGYSITAISGKARYYRARVGETPTAWGRTSVPVRR